MFLLQNIEHRFEISIVRLYPFGRSLYEQVGGLAAEGGVVVGVRGAEGILLEGGCDVDRGVVLQEGARASSKVLRSIRSYSHCSRISGLEAKYSRKRVGLRLCPMG